MDSLETLTSSASVATRPAWEVVTPIQTKSLISEIKSSRPQGQQTNSKKKAKLCKYKDS